jgi:hypothetical protein
VRGNSQSKRAPEANERRTFVPGYVLHEVAEHDIPCAHIHSDARLTPRKEVASPLLDHLGHLLRGRRQSKRRLQKADTRSGNCFVEPVDGFVGMEMCIPALKQSAREGMCVPPPQLGSASDARLDVGNAADDLMQVQLEN